MMTRKVLLALIAPVLLAACGTPSTAGSVPSTSPAATVSLPGQLGVVARTSSEQVTYNNWPLYTFAGDSRPDQTNGQGVFGFGGKWFVATPGLRA